MKFFISDGGSCNYDAESIGDIEFPLRRYRVAANYIQRVDNNQNKGATMYINGRPKVIGNIVGFMNSTRLVATTKKPNFIFEGCEGNLIFVCATKTIVPGEELLIDYNLN
jgi:hypothetical protein